MTRSNRSSSGIPGQRFGTRRGSIVTDISGNPDLLGADLAGDSEESEDDECPVLPKPTVPDSELSPLYWFLLKVVKYIKVIIRLRDTKLELDKFSNLTFSLGVLLLLCLPYAV